MTIERKSRSDVSTHAHIAKHVAGQIIAPFVGKIVGMCNGDKVQVTETVQWATSAIAAVVLIEVQHRVFTRLREKIGKVQSSIAAILGPSAVTSGMSYLSHSIAGTDAKTSGMTVGILSLLGYSTLQCYQLLSERKEKGINNENE